MAALPSLLLLLLATACLAAGSPGPARARVRRSGLTALPGGIPLSHIFALCENERDGEDIGPCLAEILTGLITRAKPSFAEGLKIGSDFIVLEPLSLDDVDPKKKKSFQVSVTNLLLHGISTLHINNVTLNAQRLALNLSFDNVTAVGDVKLKYLFFSAMTEVRIELTQLGVEVRADWTLDLSPDDPNQLDMVLSNATCRFELGGLRASFANLGNLGAFLQSIINANSDTLVRFLIPELERSVTDKLNHKLNRIKIAD